MIYLLILVCVLLIFCLREMKKVKVEVMDLKYKLRVLKSYRYQIKRVLDALVPWAKDDPALATKIESARDANSASFLAGLESSLKTPASKNRKKLINTP